MADVARIRRSLLALTGLLAVVGWLVGGIEWPSMWTEFWPVFLMGAAVVGRIVFDAVRELALWVWHG